MYRRKLTMGNANIFGVAVATILLIGLGIPRIVHAQVTTAISPTLGTGNLNTRVNSSTGLCVGNCVITGGTRTGTNLYHSFGQFGVGPGDVANFFNETGLPTSSILGRVTGGNISNIFGSITATNFPGANLFLMNPNGFLFGPNASVNVAGMATFTTADYMRMVDGGRFNARLDAIAADVLTSTPVAAFGFLGSNPAAITFEGGQLTVTGGTGLKLVGGDINLTSDASGMPSSITAPGRTVQLTSVAGPGEVATDSGLPASGMSLGNITFTDGSVISTAGDPSFGDGSGGAVYIRGGQFVARGTQILTGPAIGSAGQGGIVTISSTNNAAFANFTTIDTSSSFSTGNAGAVSIDALNVELEDTFVLARVESDGSTAGAGGAITLTGTNSVNLTRSFLVADTFSSNGNGGAVTVAAPSVTLQDSGMFTGTFGGGSGGAATIIATSTVSLINSNVDTHTSFTTGNSGDVTITAPTIILSGTLSEGVPTIDTSTDSFEFPTAGNAGDIIIAGTNVTFSNSALIQSHASSFGSFSKGGTIQVNGEESILLETGTLIRTTTTSQGKAGDITLTSKNVTVSESFVASETIGPGGGGTIKIIGTENIALESGSVISTNSAAAVGNEGPAGHIELDTPQLTIAGGTTVRSQTFGVGLGGTITVKGTNGAAQSVLIDGMGSGLFTDTNSFIQDGTIVGTGPGGSISLNANSVTIQNGGTVSANTSGLGNAGSILVEADALSITSDGRITSSSSIRQTPFFDGEVIPSPTGNAGAVTIEGLASPAQSVLMTGTGSGVFTDTQGTGAGGNIFLNGNTVTLQNGGTLSATTSGTESSATGGTITVNASQVQVNSGGLLTASTTGAGSGGSISVNAGSSFSSNAGTVSSTATQATGGDINISAGQSVTLNNGSVITASSSGEGNAGNIQINAGQQYTSTNSSVTTEAEQASGGNIAVLAIGLVHLTNSEINASVEGSTTTVGGNILIDPVYVILENSQILAQATQGQGGNINIFYTGALLADPSTVISASSQFGQSGTVTIQSPISPASGKIIPLGQRPLVATALLSQRCAALAGGSISSFTVAGRDSLPAEPGGWLSDPLALRMSESENGPVREADGMISDETPLLSVRKIAPPGFLTQAFAVDASGCS
jgi:filamentous hemagglutinin family protein